MHSDVDAPGEQGVFEFLDEDAALTDVGEGTASVKISRRRDGHERDARLGVGSPDRLGHSLCLGEREPAAPSPEPKQHVESRRSDPLANRFGRVRRRLVRRRIWAT